MPAIAATKSRGVVAGPLTILSGLPSDVSGRKKPADPVPPPTEKVRCRSAHHVAKQVLRDRDMEEEVLKRKPNNIARPVKPAVHKGAERQLERMHAVERGRRRTVCEKRDCSADFFALQFLEGCSCVLGIAKFF